MTNVQMENGMLSPAASEPSVTHTASDGLPVPRAHPLSIGSSKRNAVIRYLDARLLKITGRYAKSFAADPSDTGSDSGYTSFAQVIADLDSVLDVVWVTGTLSLQIPYLLTLASHFRDYMHSFDFATRSFVLARKLDLAFSTILAADTALTAPLVNMTERVRIRSLAQETKYEIIGVASKSGQSTEVEDVFSEDEDNDSEADTDALNEEGGSYDRSVTMSLGQVYEKTLDILGSDLSSLPPLAPDRKPTPPPLPDDVEVIEF